MNSSFLSSLKMIISETEGTTMGLLLFALTSLEMKIASCYLTLEERYILRCGFSFSLLSEDDHQRDGTTMKLLLFALTSLRNEDSKLLLNTRREIYSQMWFSPFLSSPLLFEDDPQRGYSSKQTRTNRSSKKLTRKTKNR